MKKLFTSCWMLAFGLLALTSLISCEKEEDLDTTPRVTCVAGAAGTAMLGETVTVNASNISAETEVTVKFGREKTLTRKGPGTLSYAFVNAGLKSIRVTTSPEEVQKTVWLVEVQALESIQTVAERLKANPDLCLVMCHRANTSTWTIAENSLSAINKCIEEKVDILENDVYTTKDGVLVVSHDGDIGRETTGSGQIKNLTLAQIKSYYLKDRNGNQTADKMLTFDEYLDACKGQIYINVDIGDRDASVTAVVNAITRKGMTQQCLIYCNTVDKIKEAYKANPEANVYTSTGTTVRNAMLEGGLPGHYYFTQCSYYPQSSSTSASGSPSSEGCTSSSSVAESAAAGAITTVNAIYTMDTKTFYPKNFTKAQVEEIYKYFPSCQCIHADVGAETRAALLAAGKQLLR
ncbi:MAG: glycerophosphodiester phosphodiesterase family protein [Bacteroidales bacterium]|nr:glycerophosphodiester phosphodiesterase family protein [Bacteroidales bacterium]